MASYTVMQNMLTLEKLISLWEANLESANSVLWEGTAKNILYVLRNKELDLKHKRSALHYYGRDAGGMSIAMWYDQAAQDLTIIINRENRRASRERMRFEKMDREHSEGSLLP